MFNLGPLSIVFIIILIALTNVYYSKRSIENYSKTKLIFLQLARSLALLFLVISWSLWKGVGRFFETVPIIFPLLWVGFLKNERFARISALVLYAGYPALYAFSLSGLTVQFFDDGYSLLRNIFLIIMSFLISLAAFFLLRNNECPGKYVYKVLYHVICMLSVYTGVEYYILKKPEGNELLFLLHALGMGENNGYGEFNWMDSEWNLISGLVAFVVSATICIIITVAVYFIKDKDGRSEAESITGICPANIVIMLLGCFRSGSHVVLNSKAVSVCPVFIALLALITLARIIWLISVRISKKKEWT